MTLSWPEKWFLLVQQGRIIAKESCVCNVARRMSGWVFCIHVVMQHSKISYHLTALTIHAQTNVLCDISFVYPSQNLPLAVRMKYGKLKTLI